MEFQIPSLRIQVCEQLSERESEWVRLETLCEFEEHLILHLKLLELEQHRQNEFIDRRRRGNETEFGIGTSVLVFQTHMGSMPRKLWLWWTRPYWIIGLKNGTFELSSLTR